MVEDAFSGAEIAPHLPALDVTRLPLCLQRGMGRSAAGWLSSDVHSILCSVSGPACALELFVEKFSLSLSLSFFSLVIPQFGLLSHISSLRLSSGHSGPVLNATHTSLFSPRSLVADSHLGYFWATSLLGVAIWHIFCGFFFFFSSQLCCPLRFQNSPQTRR